jgi:DNA-binding CsgD family transcriptional regulator
MAEGLTDRQIAQCLWVSENTVHTHVRRVLAKLESSTRQEAVLFALRNVSRGGLRTW